MPEMPEVETIRRDLAEQILRQPIVSFNLLSPKTAHNSAAFFKKSLVGQKFRSLQRRGKLLIFGLASGQSLLIHLKMTGQLVYSNRNKRLAGGHSLSTAGKNFAASIGGELPNRYTRVWLEFKNGGRLFFNDLRKFGYWKIVTPAELTKILQNNYGPEPLTPEFTAAKLNEVIKNKKLKIKALLLDQKRIAGLGNIYVDEALWAARIAPTRLANSLKPREVTLLWRSIQQIITEAIEYRGTTFNNYVDSSGRKGNFSKHLKVYGRAGEKCHRCGAVIKKEKVAGRGTHFCPCCQK
jgi:formamidopyrimidine-DNA glycosylase